MKLWLISQNVYNGYDIYDSAVVAAETDYDARRIHPSELYDFYDEDLGEWGYILSDGSRKTNTYSGGSWVNLDQVKVQLIGMAEHDLPAGVVCASFNAG